MRFALLLGVLGAAGTLALLGATAGRAERAGPRPVPLVHPIETARWAPICHAGTVQRLGSLRSAYAAVVRRRAVVFRRPGASPFARFGPVNANHFPTVLGVRAAVLGSRCQVQWLRVQLPLRPNGVVGYVRPRDVVLGAVTTRIVVDLSQRRLVLYRSGRRVLQTTVAVGAPSTPTPTGSFYVNQRLVPKDPHGAYGPAALGISAHSDVLLDWTQGGPIAIHGTNEPWSIGRAASNGCVRVENGVLLRLFRLTPAGTPVTIKA
jgi:lipoprotein-anchoring transpeptidase ErfK/SrfK